MRTDRWREIEAALDELLDLSKERRRARVAEIVDADPDLARELQPFLEEDDDTDGPLDRPLETFAAAVLGDATAPTGEEPSSPKDSPVDRRIGPYRVLGEIGHGGMGTVYLAERTDGEFEQRVALKLVRGDRTDIADRFRHERQILARLRHPHIATLFDGGATDDGEPYFAMEFVEGERITGYCDRNRLGVDARIALFEDVCRAVQYAHRNLVVHRDLKPGNVLVTRDGTVKLLDFGIAKVVSSEDDAAATTQHFLTPAYAAPEQVLGEPTSTASDIYSLGVLLYELLTGRNPHGDTSRSVEMARAVVEKHPPSASASVGAEIAAARDADPETLRRRLRGDLDNILQKALRKAPEERYASAEDFRADLERHRRQLPVSARPATWKYRTVKFVRRNRLGAAALAAILLTIIAGVAGIAWQASVAAQERDVARAEAARAEAVKEYLLDVFGAADPSAQSGAALTAVELAERGVEQLGEKFADDPDVRADVVSTLGAVFMRLAKYDRADSLLGLALARYRETDRVDRIIATLLSLGDAYQQEFRLDEAEAVLLEAASLADATRSQDEARAAIAQASLGVVYTAQRRFPEAEAALRAGIEVLRRLEGHDEDVAEQLLNLGVMSARSGDLQGSADKLFEALEILRRIEPEGGVATARVLGSLADILDALDRTEEAATLGREALQMYRRELGGAAHLELAIICSNVAGAVRDLGEMEEAEQLGREAIEMFIAVVGPEHPHVGTAYNNLGVTLNRRGDVDGAIEAYATSVRIVKASLGPRHPRVASNLHNYAMALSDEGRYAEAEEILLEAISISEEGGLDGVRASYPIIGLASVYRATERWEQCEERTREAWELRKGVLGEGHSDELFTRIELGSVITARGRFDEARPLLDSAIEDCRAGGLEVRARFPDALEARITLARDSGEPAERLSAFMQELLELYREDEKPDEERIAALETELAELAGS